jgi:hypothetical protein
VRYLILITLVACGPKHLVVTWVSAGVNTSERIEIESSGQGRYTSATDGVPEKNERVVLSRDQLDELAEMFRSHRVCELTDDPAYTPVAGEGKISLELAFPDQRCKVVLWDFEWQRGRAKDVTETMRSMRPLRVPRSQRSR